VKTSMLASLDSLAFTLPPRGPRNTGIADRIAARRALWRERREIIAIGAAGRIELDALLQARGKGGLSVRVWPEHMRAADALACAASGHLHDVATAHAAAILRSVAR
jgi:hypothetical protein